MQDELETIVLPDEPTTPNAVMKLVQLGIERGQSVDVLERLVALAERVTDRQAASEFARELALFQSECPPVSKSSKATVATRSGGTFSYNFADLTTIAQAVGPLLHTKGFSYSWDSVIKDKMMSVTCTLRHVNGHSAIASFMCPTDAATSAMSEQQKFAAALSYAKRMSLIQVLGITTADPDTDGANPEVISKEQVAELRYLADEVGADVQKFLGYMKYATFEEITKTDFNRARTALNAKRKAPPK